MSKLVFKGSVEHKELVQLLSRIKQSYGLDFTATKRVDSSHTIPLSVFATHLSPLSALVTYLKSQEKSVQDISSLLKRSQKTIYHALADHILVKESKFFIPIELFQTRKLSVMEIVVSYLHEQYHLRFSDIAQLLHKDARTVWTWNHRAQQKKAA